MIGSIVFVTFGGLVIRHVCKKVNVPPLIGFLGIGIFLGPFILDVLSDDLLNRSSEIRTIALIIILSKAGLAMNISDFKHVGGPAIRMCFVPAMIEIIGTMLFAPLLIGLSLLESALLGSIIAAVSPAVVVPRMVQCIEKGYGKEHSVPQIILAGASVEDVIVLVLFSSLLGLHQSADSAFLQLIDIPVSMILGTLACLVVGNLLVWLFKRYRTFDSMKVLLLLSISLVFMAVESRLAGIVAFSGMLSVLGINVIILNKNKIVAQRLAQKFNYLWIVGEIFLFVLVGASVNIDYAIAAGFMPILLILVLAAIRMSGVFLSLSKTRLTLKEKSFCMIAYLPKATVQAAVGSVPLSLGLPAGEMILTVAVLAILITAPMGAFLIDSFVRNVKI